jgi:hypothetical protein
MGAREQAISLFEEIKKRIKYAFSNGEEICKILGRECITIYI